MDALELHPLSPTDTSRSALNYYLMDITNTHYIIGHAFPNATGHYTLQLTTSWVREVLVFLPKDGNRGDPAPTNSLEFLALAGSTLSTLRLPPPPAIDPRLFHIGEVTNLTCMWRAQENVS